MRLWPFPRPPKDEPAPGTSELDVQVAPAEPDHVDDAGVSGKPEAGKP